MNQVIYSVREFNELVNAVLGEGIGEVTVAGEVTGYQIRQNLWVSFDLKDEGSILNCFTSLSKLDLPLADGIAVLVTGTPRIYVPYGKYSLSIRTVEIKGEGALQKAFDQLRRKLEGEGLFDPGHKKPLPAFPEAIGLVTSKEGAAIHDIESILARRMGGLTLYLAPVLVQGKNAAGELVGALNYFNAYRPVEVIILGRGGGSLEDLQAFNSEKVARAIFASKIPIITGIGHENNMTIADLVADARAATPSNAAELCVADRRAVGDRITGLTEQMSDRIGSQIRARRSEIASTIRLLPEIVANKLGRIITLLHQFRAVVGQAYQVVKATQATTVMAYYRMGGEMASQMKRAQGRLEESRAVLGVLNPRTVLARGYTITWDAATNRPITTRGVVPSEGAVRTQFSDGTLTTLIVPSWGSKKELAQPDPPVTNDEKRDLL